MYLFLKRFFDFTISFIGLLLLSPLLFIVALLIFMLVGRPVFFKQERAGINGVPFFIYKFRTMSNNVDMRGNLLPDKDRIFKLGGVLRRASIDELPALYNVLVGEMSLVGPRPLHVRYVSRYDSSQIRRLSVLPGITGLAQINGRNAIAWNQKFIYDVWYVDNSSFLMDLQILLITFLKVFDSSNVNSSEDETMAEFMGDDSSKTI